MKAIRDILTVFMILTISVSMLAVNSFAAETEVPGIVLYGPMEDFSSRVESVLESLEESRRRESEAQSRAESEAQSRAEESRRQSEAESRSQANANNPDSDTPSFAPNLSESLGDILMNFMYASGAVMGTVLIILCIRAGILLGMDYLRKSR